MTQIAGVLVGKLDGVSYNPVKGGKTVAACFQTLFWVSAHHGGLCVSSDVVMIFFVPEDIAFDARRTYFDKNWEKIPDGKSHVYDSACPCPRSILISQSPWSATTSTSISHSRTFYVVISVDHKSAGAVSDLSVHCPSPKPLQHTRLPTSGHLHSTVSTWQQRASQYSFRIKGGLLAFAQNAFLEYVSTVLEESKRDGWRKAKTCHGKQWSHSPATRWWAATWKNHGKLICRLFVFNHPLGCHLTQTIGASQSALLPLSDISTLGCMHVCISKNEKGTTSYINIKTIHGI